jgi:hypothetical protein
MKIVINGCYGGFGLSQKAIDLYMEKAGMEKGKNVSEYDIARDDPILVEVVETLGKEASGSYADLHIVEIPDDVNWVIKEYDGFEHVAEVHRTWS